MAMRVDWLRAIRVEHAVADIIATQERHGVWFDTRLAKWYIHLLTERILRIDQVAVPLMPRILTVVGNVSKPFLKSGLPSVALERWRGKTGCTQDVGGPFTAIEFLPFDFGKVGLFKEWMLNNGWVPDQWNVKDLTVDSAGKRLDQDTLNRNINGYIQDLRDSPSGKLRIELLGIPKGSSVGDVKALLRKRRKVPTTPKITESSLDSIDTPLGKMVMERMVWSHRRSLLQGLVEAVRPDHRLGARANPCATPTARMRHSVVVNIPAPRSPFGKEIRRLFRAPMIDGVQWKFVGYDGAGLELRMLAHAINDEGFTQDVVAGDIHTRNQLAAGLPTRDDAKTFIYAFLYGAGDAKIGLIVGGTSKDGARLRAQFLEANPRLKQLIEMVRAQAEKGYVIGLDGRKLWMRRDEFGEVMSHKALNTLLQGAGAIVMKYAMVWLDEQVAAAGLRAHKVLDVHDEGQWECHPEDVDKLREFMDNCVRVAGEQLGLNCPLASDSKVGDTWYSTH